MGLLVCQPQKIFCECLFSKSNTAGGSAKAGRSNVAGGAHDTRGADRAGVTDHPGVGRVKQGQGSHLSLSFGVGCQCSIVTERLRSLSSSRPHCILRSLVSSKSLRVTLRSRGSRGKKQERGKGEDESEHFEGKEKLLKSCQDWEVHSDYQQRSH